MTESTDVFPSGRRNRCPPLPLPRNSRIQTFSTTYHHGETVRIECELDFELQGPEEVHCDHGRWTEPPRCTGQQRPAPARLSPSPPVSPNALVSLNCPFSEEKERMACEAPPLVENSAATLRSKVYYSGDKVTYRCESGYDLRGPKEITCKRGTWTLPPECVGACNTFNADS